MSDEDRAGHRVSCLQCGEQILDIARTCPYCKLSALVDVVVRTPLDDRRRYELARRLVSSPMSAGRSLSAIQKDLLASPPVLVRDATRNLAEQAIRLAQGVGADAVAQSTRPAAVQVFKLAPHPAPSSFGGLALLVIGVAIAAFAWVNRGQLEDLLKFPAPATAAPTPAKPQGPERARAALASVVSIRCGEQTGSGFFVAPDLVLTNHHVLCGSRAAVQVATIDGRRSLGLVEKTDAFLDLGLVRVRMSGEPPRALMAADAAALEAGQQVFMVGSPSGLAFSFHEGRVSRVGQPLLGLGYIQFDARVNPGNSGGPLLDDAGRVIGVVSMKMRGEGLGLALPINYAFDYKGRGLLPSPPGWTTTDAFGRLTQAAELADASSELDVKNSMAAPMILSVRSDPYHRPLILVGRAAEKEPPSEDFEFEFRSGPEALCRRPAHTARWQEELGRLNLPPRLAAWLDERRLRIRLYTTEVSPGLSGCPAFGRKRITITLGGGEGPPEPFFSR